MNKKSDNNPKWMLITNEIIAIAGVLAALGAIATAIISGIYFQIQTDEMKKATQLEWRPYLNLDIESPKFSFYHVLGNEINDSTKAIPLDLITIDEPKYKDYKYLFFKFDFGYKCKNTGKTPLRIRRNIFSAFTENDWNQIYNKSEIALVDSIRAIKNTIVFSADYVIPPDSASLITQNKTINKIFTKSDLNAIDNSFRMYSYWYIEYEDMMDNKYNLLLIYCNAFEVSFEQKRLQFLFRGTSLEKLRWDI
jgi:hypothetical protein